MSTPGSKRFSGFHQGNWYINGVNKGKNLSQEDMGKLSMLQGTISNSIANQSLTAQNKEKDLALRQSNLQYEESQRQVGILSSQVDQTAQAQAKSQELQTQKTMMDEAQAAYAAAESQRSSALASEQGRSSLTRSRRIRNRSRSRQQGLLSNRLMQT